MSIAVSDLITDFIVVDSFAAVNYVRDQVEDGKEWDSYIVVNMGSAKYAVFLLGHLIDSLKKAQGGTITSTGIGLDQIDTMLADYTVDGLDINGSLTFAKARKQAILAPLKMLVAVDGNEVKGIIDPGKGNRSGDIPNVDFDSVPRGQVIGQSGGVLKDAGDAPASAKGFDPRIMNVELAKGFNRFDPNKEPLTAGDKYKLSFFIDSKSSKFTIVKEEDIGAKVFENTDADTVDLTIQLESEDFDIDANEKTLTVPRTGASKRTDFEISPKADGAATIQAIILKDDAFVQLITLKFHVGSLFKQETQGHDINDMNSIRRRSLSLTILNTGKDFQMIMSGPTAAMGTIPINQRHLASIVKELRQELLDIVHLQASGMKIYQQRIDIPENVNTHALQRLAKAGKNLLNQLFFGPGHDLQIQRIGDALVEMAKGKQMNIQIFSQQFMLPWGLLYVGDVNNPQPEMFLGLRHVIEHIPLQPSMQVTDQTINTSEGISVALNVNTDIDAQMGTEIIGRQLKYWQELNKANSKISVDVREDAYAVMGPISDGQTVDDILYFYCHAESYNLDEENKGGPGQSKLIMTGHEELTLELMRDQREPFAGKPLVFINACESAELSPEFYDGFVPYFVSKGARGVIGTECETPALFAEEWANRFFKMFLGSSKSLGDIFLELRRDFYFNHNNIMGLLYALYVDGDTYISEPLLEAEA